MKGRKLMEITREKFNKTIEESKYSILKQVENGAIKADEAYDILEVLNAISDGTLEVIA